MNWNLRIICFHGRNRKPAEVPGGRIDTHPDNTVMQNMLAREGFVHRGTIYVREDNDLRMAFERI